MPYVCYNCGNKRNFRGYGREHGTCNYTCDITIEFDEDGSGHDYYDQDDYQYENHDVTETDSDGIEECSSCGSGEVHDLDSADWDLWKEDTPLDEQENFNEDDNSFDLDNTNIIKENSTIVTGKLVEIRNEILSGEKKSIIRATPIKDEIKEFTICKFCGEKNNSLVCLCKRCGCNILTEVKV